jgi:peptidoglycan/LPS O-acetylase OafA/YrhL
MHNSNRFLSLTEKHSEIDPHKRANRIEFLDALRGYAFLGVLCVHVAQATQLGIFRKLADSGMYGVQLFFVLSAFTLTKSWIRLSQTSNAPLLTFYLRRALRILPIFWLFAVVYFFLHRENRNSLLPQEELLLFLKSILFLGNWNGYLEAMIVPGEWSIINEVLFYLSLPITLFFIRNLWQSLVFVWLTLMLLVVAKYLLSQSSNLSHIPTYFWFPNHLPVFALGILLQFSVQNKSIIHFFSIHNRPRYLMLICFVNLALLPIQVYNEYTHIIYALNFFFIILALVCWTSNIPFLFSASPIRYIGTISYSCYLTHFLVIQSLSHLLNYGSLRPYFGPFSQPIYFTLYFSCSLAATVAIASFCYLFLEKPLSKIADLPWLNWERKAG